MYGKVTIEVTETEKGERIQVQGDLHRASEFGHIKIVATLVDAFNLSPAAVLAGMLLCKGQTQPGGYDIRIPTDLMEKLKNAGD